MSSNGTEPIVLVGEARRIDADRKLALASGREVVCIEDVDGLSRLLESRRCGMVLADSLAVERGAREKWERCTRMGFAENCAFVMVAPGDIQSETLEQAWRCGMHDFLQRPLPQGEIERRLSALMVNAANMPARARRAVAVVCDDASRKQYLQDLCAFSGLLVVEPPSLSLSLGSQSAGLESSAQEVDLVIYAPPVGKPLAADRFIQLLARARRLRSTQSPPMLVLYGGCEAITLSQMVDVHVESPDISPEGFLFRVNGLANKGGFVELRAWSRVPFFYPVLFREAGGAKQEWTTGYSFDVSSGGLFVRTLVPVRPRSPVELVLRLTTMREDLPLTGVVAWANPFVPRQTGSYPVGMGVQFLGAISPRLGQLIRACTPAA